MTQSQAFTLVASIVFFSLGIGMIYVTWFNAASRLAPVLSARWRLYGPLSSKFGAAAQSSALLSLGLVALLSGLGYSAKVAFVPFVASALMCVVARLSDLGRDEA